MAVSTLVGPDGKTYKVQHPEGASKSDIIRFAVQSSKPKPAPNKPGVVGNLARGIAAGAAQSGYDTLNEVAQELTRVTSIREKAKLAFDKWAGNPGAEDKTIEDIDKRQRESEASIQKYIGDTGDLSGQAFGVDEGRLSADVGRGIGQLPLMVLTKGASAVPMAMNEVRKDAEETFGTKYADMSDEQRDKVRVAQGVYSAFSLVANKVGLKGMGLGKLDDFLKGGKTIKGSVVKKVLKDQARGGGTEFATEFSEAAAMDQIARVYDPDREYSFDDVKRYAYEGLVGGIVGTTVATGTSIGEVAFSGNENQSSFTETKKSDLNKEVEERPALEVPRTVQVEYKELDGQVRVFPLAVTEGQDPMAAAEEALAGRYDPAFGVTITDQPQPVGPEQELDLPDQAPDATQEDVPVQPEAAAVPAAVEPAQQQAPVLNTVQVDLQGLQPEELQNVVQQLRQKLVNAREAESQGKPVLGGSASIEADLNNVKSYIVTQQEQAPIEPEAAIDEGIGPYDDSELTEPNSITGNVKTLNEIFDLGKKSWENTSGDPRRAQGTSNTIGKNFGEKAKEAHMRGWKSSMEAELKERQARKAPTPEQAPEARSFSLPQNLKKGKPGYAQTQNITFASDLERATYSATTATQSDPGKRKRQQYRNLLKESGYSDAEINTMGREVRDQMKGQYKGKGSPISVSLGQDVVAEAAPLKPKAKKATRGYDLLSSPFISNYSGPGPTDTSVPDYGSFHYVVSNPQQKELNAAIKSGAVDYLADQVANEAAAMMNDPAIAAGIGWYGRMRQRLKEIFGNDIDIFTQLLGTTSAQTPVETNFRFSVDLYNRFKAGEFDANIKEYLKLYGQMKAGTLGDLLLKDKVKNSKGVLYTPEMIKKSEPSALLSSAAEHYNLEPAQTSGKKYGTNSYPALKALAQVWFNERLSKDKMTPKTPQFTMNLNGESLEATIDVWAARLLRRVIYADQSESRIFPSEETAVSNPDFALGQLVFRRAAEKLNMNPDDLQALVWFGEKQIWDRNGWTGAAGALKSSFDEPADVFYPIDGSTRTEADAKLILDFLAKERLVKRDIEFPDAVTETRQNENRKEYDKFLRQRVISDYLKSRGSGAVYESSSVESNRKRQVTRSINRLSSYTGKVSYKNGTGKEPKGSFKVVKRGPVLDENRFSKIAKANKDGNKFGSSVDVFKASDYKGYDLIITSSERGESVTMAISPDGELSSVTKSSNATARDVDAAFDMAISTGKVKFLNGFETVLPVKYASYGFTPVARLKFNPEFQPDGWSTQTYRNFNGGQPDVVFMRFDGTVGSEYDGTGFPEVDTYEEGVRLASQEDVTAQAADTAVEDRGPQDTYANGSQVMDAIEKDFDPIANKIGIAIRPAMGTNYVARYNATQQVIEYNPMLLLKRSKEGIRAAMREEIIHAAMHEVLMQKQRKTGRGRNPGDVWVEFFETFAKTLTAQERVDIGEVYTTLTTYHALGAEYSRAVVQNLLYGEFSEQYVMESQGGPAWNLIVDLLRSVQAYMAKVLGPMRKTNPEAAQVIVDTVELLKAADPSIRPKSQDVVADAYNETDKNTAKENTEAGERVGQDSSERIREQRKWFDGEFRETASKYLTPVITRLNRINPMFGRILQNLDTAIRTRSFKYRKQTEAFFNALNSIKGPEFLELKQLLFFSPTTEEANLPANKRKSQRRDALLHKHGLLNMYRLDVEPILAQIYTEYSALGMPQIGYLEQYFPRVINDLKGLINSYGHKAKRTFELLVDEENLRRSEIKDSEGLPAPLPAMQDSELARFFQEFLQGKFRLDINGVRLPGNVKVREISLIPPDKLKYYDNPGIAFGKYTNNMTRAIESFKVVGDTRKGRLQGTLGELTQELFVSGQIDQADAYEVKSLTELVTTQFAAENEILKSLGTLTYMATLINPGPVLVQIMDLYKVALYRGLRGVVSGTYRTVTGNRRFDIERDFSIAKTQLSAEFEDPSVLQKALDFGLSRLVPFRQMDTAMKHASIEAAYDDFVRKAKAPVGSKKYEQLLSELTITMGRVDALQTIEDLKLDKAMDSTLVKEALLAELLQRQPLTYLQVPEGYQTDPNKRLFYKLSTFMLLDLNYNRQEFMNDLGGPGKTLQQRTAALRRLTYMATLLTMFGLPSDLLDDWIAGKDTYIPEHVMNNMLGMFGLSRYTSTQVLEKGLVEGAVQRFTPPAINILMEGESSIRSWVKGDKELFDMKAWKFSPLSDVWYYKSGAGAESQKKWRKENLKKGVRPDIRRS